MQVREIKEKGVWENFVRKQRYTSHFQAWNWAEFERSLGSKFETLGMFERGKLIGLLPIKHITAKRGKYLQLRRGPIFDFKDRNIWEEFFEFIRKKAKDGGYWFVRLSPLVINSEEQDYRDVLSHLRECPMHDVDGEITWVLNLLQSEEEIVKNMRKNTRYYVRKAERDGVKVIKTQEMKYMDDFWEIYKDTVKRQKWTAYSWEYIKKEFEAFRKDDQIDLYLAKYRGKFIACSLIVYYCDQAIYHHSGSLTAFSKIPASHLIQWEAIKEAKRRGLRWYNLFGVSPLIKENGEYKAQAGHPWAGLTFFKLGFGGEVRQFIHAKDLPMRNMYYLTAFFERIERWRRGY